MKENLLKDNQKEEVKTLREEIMNKILEKIRKVIKKEVAVVIIRRREENSATDL